MSLGRKAQSGNRAPSAAQAAEERTAEAAKIARLRELRLAKEAAERSATEDAAPPRARLKPGARVRGQPRMPV